MKPNWVSRSGFEPNESGTQLRILDTPMIRLPPCHRRPAGIRFRIDRFNWSVATRRVETRPHATTKLHRGERRFNRTVGRSVGQLVQCANYLCLRLRNERVIRL
ncbi:hypothetical protein PUN28_012438 [Cardiocondyla obscurior]|uniref:Uncharacterized protein n=1 Tax=Cardiocondyla obscurior TaxID=286306 RepID=A0AAW2FFG4_9HYME